MYEIVSVVDPSFNKYRTTNKQAASRQSHLCCK